MNANTPLVDKSYGLGLLAVVLALVLSVAAGPLWTVHRLAAAVENNDPQALADLINEPLWVEIAKKFINTELIIRWKSDTQTPDKALANFVTATQQTEQKAKTLISPAGLQHFLRGEMNETQFADLHEAAQWIGAAKISWQSPISATADLPNPGNGLITRLKLYRDGLFSWRVACVELPIDEIFSRFSEQKKTPATHPSPPAKTAAPVPHTTAL